MAEASRIYLSLDKFAMVAAQRAPSEERAAQTPLTFDTPIPGVHSEGFVVDLAFAKTATPQSALSQTHSSVQSRLPLSPTAEEDIANLFSGLRRHLRMSQSELAGHLGTSLHTLAALETCQLHALPQWPETARVVQAYLGMFHVDATPVLGALKGLIRNQISDVPRTLTRKNRLTDRLDDLSQVQKQDLRTPKTRKKDGSGGDTPTLREALGPVLKKSLGQLPLLSGGHKPMRILTQASQLFGQMRTLGRRKAELSGDIQTGSKDIKRPQPVLRFALASTIGLALILAAAATPGWAVAARTMPDPVGAAMRQVQDFVLLRFADEDQGLPWIDVRDPRSRRGNKLQSEPQ